MTSAASARAAATLLAVLACTPAPRPPDAELHRLAVMALREEVAAPAPLLVHPLLIRRTAGAPLDLEHAGFNPFDSASVPALLELAGADLRLCATGPSGSCEVPRGRVALVLSEPHDLGRNGVGVGAVVIDGRGARVRQRYFLVRVKPGPSAWEVVEVRPAGPRTGPF